MNKLISWFEIPALDLNRASAFYEKILAVTLNRGDMGPTSLAVFPTIATWPPAARSSSAWLQPVNGRLHCLPPCRRLARCGAARIEPAGGEILLPRTELPPTWEPTRISVTPKATGWTLRHRLILLLNAPRRPALSDRATPASRRLTTAAELAQLLASPSAPSIATSATFLCPEFPSRARPASVTARPLL